VPDVLSNPQHRADEARHRVLSPRQPAQTDLGDALVGVVLLGRDRSVSVWREALDAPQDEPVGQAPLARGASPRRVAEDDVAVLLGHCEVPHVVALLV
jgi:hypothetical protein